MKNEVSALMDGELDNHEAEHAIAILKENDQLREDWEIYHLIGDTIRHESTFSTHHTQYINNEFAAEPTPITSHSSNKHHNRKTAVYAIAASVAAAIVTTWFGLQNIDQSNHDTNTIMANQKTITAQPLPAVTSITAPNINTAPSLLAHPLAPAEIDDYLFVHKEFLPGAVTHSQSHYVRPVTNTSERYGR
ncbi:MAG: sigma-E factor negative regulatory protein [Gammaproteobacteria bacterium]|nr:sigma-E factor negative regulatory protein [Gammaproteobacteria bacterium]